MSDPTKTSGRIVAELGRPETPAESANRKAESSRLYRERKTINNLVYALLATLGIVLIIVLMVPRGNGSDLTRDVDYKKIAAQGAGAEPSPLLAPDLPKSWSSNAAELRSSTGGGIDVWHIGLISPAKQYVGIDQGFNADDTWISDTLENVRATGTKTIDGVSWVVYDNRQGQSASKDIDYGLVAQQGVDTVVLSGTATASDFEKVAAALASQLKAEGSN